MSSFPNSEYFFNKEFLKTFFSFSGFFFLFFVAPETTKNQFGYYYF